ncbi:hypothetical protein WICPIJ_006555 [Wickerhamomyces pijperi]|uniref:Transmembrane protein n=1 Tax=Wickerhamomyces pijperi TaxID=599730 RepID=A0A9P8Q221_WICPI|nr:hypothetical protein WICPIJ_006555 [Wickerhamomyces pijperi]
MNDSFNVTFEPLPLVDAPPRLTGKFLVSVVDKSAFAVLDNGISSGSESLAEVGGKLVSASAAWLSRNAKSSLCAPTDSAHDDTEGVSGSGVFSLVVNLLGVGVHLFNSALYGFKPSCVMSSSASRADLLLLVLILLIGRAAVAALGFLGFAFGFGFDSERTLLAFDSGFMGCGS